MVYATTKFPPQRPVPTDLAWLDGADLLGWGWGSDIQKTQTQVAKVVQKQTAVASLCLWIL